jgi:hypothetical protein
MPTSDEVNEPEGEDEYGDLGREECPSGPGATTWEASYDEEKQHLFVDACDEGMDGPVQVITVDGRILKGTSDVGSEIESQYFVVAPGYRPPRTGETDALVVMPAIPGARIVKLTSADLAAIAESLSMDFEDLATPGRPDVGPVRPIVAVDVNGDGKGDVALVRGCSAVVREKCSEVGELLVRRVYQLWRVARDDYLGRLYRRD